ncbi:cobalamin biosynthesis protein [Companilactobacillus furfuricola]|uniref:cobalamin biosynthesis protein n=1 Tax=Companilactobacillus furfuricola TaxID=1462575 RepID=UPI000F775680|nr:cobalamin biosynthesis protein [Companilactobacillus furfuricola]
MLTTNNSDFKKNSTNDFGALLQKMHAWCPNMETNTSIVEHRLANNQPVDLLVEDYYCTSDCDFSGFSKIKQANITDQGTTPTVVISDRTDFDDCTKVIHVVPKESTLGISCREDVSYGDVQTAFALFMSINHLSWNSIKLITSIDASQNQANIQYLAQVLQAKTQFYSKEQLLQTAINYQTSPSLKNNLGIGNVASSAANLASGKVIFIPEFSSKNVSLALCH